MRWHGKRRPKFSILSLQKRHARPNEALALFSIQKNMTRFSCLRDKARQNFLDTHGWAYHIRRKRVHPSRCNSRQCGDEYVEISTTKRFQNERRTFYGVEER